MDSTELEEYQEFVETCRKPGGRKHKVIYPVTGLCAEAGEVLELVQKGLRKDDLDWDAKVDLFRDELGDVLWYAACICNDLQITLDSVIEHNIDKLNKRRAHETAK